MAINPSLDRQFTLTNFKWNLRANGHLNGEKLGACNYLKLSRVPVDIRLYWNKTNDRNTAFSLDELVRGFKIDERDEAGNAKTLNNIFLWSEGNIPIAPLSDIIELEYNGEGAMITPLLGNKSGSIDKIEKVSVVSTLDKVLNPIKVINTTNTQGFSIENFYRINANIQKPLLKYAHLYGNPPTNGKVFNCYNLSYIFTRNGHYIGNAYLNRKYNDVSVIDFAKNEAYVDKNLDIDTQNLLVGFRTGEEISHVRLYGDLGPWGITPNYAKKRISNYIIYDGNGAHRLAHMETGHFYERPCIAFDNDLANFSVELLDKASGQIKARLKNIKSQAGNVDGLLVFREKSLLEIAKIETTYDEALSLFIFKTQSVTNYIAPVQTQTSYISLIAQGQTTKKADFRFTLREVNKTSAASQTPYLYMGGLSGIKIPIRNGFELNFNNKKSGLDYVIIEIPAGDIYKVELELLNVYEDSENEVSST